MKNLEFLKSLKIKNLNKKFGEKRVIACSVAICLVVGGVAGSAIIRSKGRNALAAELTINTAKASVGTIRTTVTGTGTLASGSTKSVTAPVGIKIKKILVEEGEQVEKGQKLATVDEASVAAVLLEIEESLDDVEDAIDDLSSKAKTEGTTEYYKAKVYNSQRKELKAIRKTLKSMLSKKAITASAAGIVNGINVSEGTQVEETTSASGTSSSSTTETSGSSAVKNMSAAVTEAEAAKTITVDATVSVNSSQIDDATTGSILLLSTENASGESDNSNHKGTSEDSDNSIKIDECNISITAPTTGATPQTKLSSSEYFTGTLSWNCATDTFQGNTAYTATIVLTAKDGYAFSKSIIPSVAGADVDSEVVESDSGKSILKIKAKFAKTAAQENSKDSASDSSDRNENGQNTDGNATGTDSGASGSKGVQAAAGASGKGITVGGVGGSISASAVGSGGSSASAGSSGSSGTSASTSVDYSEYEGIAFTIAAEDETVVSINVDELDITSISKGQTATVTLDALEDQEFEGTITRVSGTALSSGSSVKYPVEITLSKTDDMLLGMSASATINVSEAENVVVIPASAVQEKGNKTFVYTQKDDDGNLSGEAEVETGLSDGDQVEITSGLSEGETVYYTRSDSEDNGGMPDMSGFGGFSGGGPGESGGPSGAPSGGPNGGSGGGPNSSGGDK